MANIADIADKENKNDIAKKADIAESIFSRQKYQYSRHSRYSSA
jgi:hypothetical protein